MKPEPNIRFEQDPGRSPVTAQCNFRPLPYRYFRFLR